MNELAQTIRDSVVSVKHKYMVSSPAQTPAAHEGILDTHSLYDFLGLDFGARNSNPLIEKKVKVIADYVKLSGSDDMVATLKELERKIGAKPLDISLVDHFYHQIRYADESVSAAQKTTTYKEMLEKGSVDLLKVAEELKTAQQNARDAKAIAHLNARKERMEERKQLLQAKIDALVPKSEPNVQG